MDDAYDLFAGNAFSADIWHALGEAGQRRAYDRGAYIYLQGDPVSHFYYLEKGRVRSFMSAADGAEQQLNVYRGPAIFGEAAFFDELPRLSSAVALEQSDITAIDHEALRRAFGKNPDLALSLLKYLARTVRLLSAHVDGMSFRQADQRIARYLLTLSRGRPGSVRCTQEEIARAVGVSRVTASRILGQFGQSGWIETAYGKLDIKNVNALKMLDDTGY